jgi:hypothetical protein
LCLCVGAAVRACVCACVCQGMAHMLYEKVPGPAGTSRGRQGADEEAVDRRPAAVPDSDFCGIAEKTIGDVHGSVRGDERSPVAQSGSSPVRRCPAPWRPARPAPQLVGIRRRTSDFGPLMVGAILGAGRGGGSLAGIESTCSKWGERLFKIEWRSRGG